MPWSAGFHVLHDTRTVHLRPLASPSTDAGADVDIAEACTAAFQVTVDAAIARGLFPALLRAGHSEPCQVAGSRCPVRVERFAAPLFGILRRGAHMTAFVRGNDGGGGGGGKGSGMKIWIARRSAAVMTYAGMLDTTVAGGVKAGMSLRECVVEEGAEEASLAPGLVRSHAVEVGTVSYVHQGAGTAGSVCPTVLHCFDLELPADVVPQPNDLEVQEFVLLGVEEVVRAMKGGEFKPNCNLVMLDFFVRHGILEGETGGVGGAVERRLRRRLPVPVGLDGDVDGDGEMG
jgi:8-oxo-dGTP pyrophosphatase MutT (NUDIX family)